MGHGAKTYELNIEPTGGPFISGIYGPVSETLPEWVDRLIGAQ